MRIDPKFMIFSCLLLVLCGTIFGAYVNNHPISTTQPDGSKLDLLASGDEFYNWLHDKDGFTIKQNDKGWYVFMDQDPSGDLVFTDFTAGKDQPAAKGLQPWINISGEKMKAIRSKANHQLRDIGNGRAPSTGTLNNISIFIRFSDQTEFGQSLTTYSTLFNGTTGNTMQSYFLEASYNALNISTSYYPTPSTMVVSWQDSHPRAYYSPYSASNTIGYSGDAQRTDREFTLLVNAVNGVSSQIPTGLNLDGDNDGYVDNVCFIIKGNSDGWAELLWPHRWSIYDRTVYINGKRVYDFNFQLSEFIASSGVGVLCHEMFHSLGSPDLYHYTSNGITPVGSWDLMENDANPPQHMGAFMKYKYGHWITSIPTLTADGTYNLNPLTSSTNNCYKIASPNSASEYFVVEYRRKTGTFENSIPGSGLLVYRINPAAEGNADGPPDEVYIYRPNGTSTVNGTINSANYSLETGRTAINSTTNPSPFLYSGAAGGLNLSQIGSAGATISFVLGNPTPGAPVCTIDSPANASFFNLNSTIPVNVTATDSGGSITNVTFYVDNVLKYTDTVAPYTWSWNTAGYSSGEHTIKATARDNSNTTTDSSVSISLLAPPNEGFETGNFTAFPWIQGGALPWTVQSADKLSGSYAARSGAIADNQTSELSLTLNITTAGNISFYQKVSSESNYDFLYFYIDEVRQGTWSGAGTWTAASYPVTTGSHTFKWKYSKDGSVTGGSDCVFIDHLIFPSYTVPTVYYPPRSLTANAGNGFVTLAWLAPSIGSPTGYRVYRNGSHLTTRTGLTYTDNAVVNGTTYSYHLTAIYSDGFSDPTDPVIAIPSAIPAQSVTLGTGTTATGTQVANPVNIYYKSEHGQAVYTRAELNAQGVNGPSIISQIGFNVIQAPVYALPNFIVRMKHTTEANVANWQTATGMQTVYTAASYTPTAGGYNMLTLSSPFTWNGIDNLVIDTAFSLLASWNSSGTTQYTSTPSGYRYTWNDDSDQTNVFSGDAVSVYRPNLKLTVIPVPVGPLVSVNPASLAFGAVQVGVTSIQQFTIQNTGDQTLTGSITTPAGYSVASVSRSLQGSREAERDPNPGLRTKAVESERNALSISINAGITNTYNLTFAPTAVAGYTGNVLVSTNDTSSPAVNISVSGTGYVPPTISLDSSSLEATLAINASGTDSFTISNTGSQSLTYTLSESPAVTWFSAAPATGSVAGSGSQLINVAFNATGLTPGDYTSTLQVSSNDPAHPLLLASISLTVTNAPPSIELPANLSFDQNSNLQMSFAPYVNDSDPQTLVLGYSGNTNVQVSIEGLAVTFSSTPDWFGTEVLTFSVFDGYSYTYDTVTVRVILNYLPQPELTGVQTSPGGTSISWNPVPHASFYKVYRSFSPGGTYEWIGSSSTTNYQDPGLFEQAFYHVVAGYQEP